MILLILNCIFCLSFVVFAYLNLNDVDPWLWIPIYMSAAICCALAIFEMYYPSVYILLMLFYLIYAGILFFAKDGVRDWIFKYKKESLVQEMQATKPYIEQTREFFGLLIITGALIINYLAAINIL
jgi:Transmembrane family 220, helix